MLIKALVLLSLPKVVLQEARLKMKKKIHVAFLDIKAAYDSVDRRILWGRCLNRGVCPDAGYCKDILLDGWMMTWKIDFVYHLIIRDTKT